MANYILKLSDSVVTLDFYSTKYRVLEGGFDTPPPQIKPQYLSSDYADGDILTASRYGNRTITINCKIIGTSLADLKANIRALQSLLNDAEKRTLSGYGNKVALEYQWGASVGSSIYFDILQGKLILPDSFLNQTLTDFWTLLDCQIVLQCAPFGRSANQDIDTGTVLNMGPNYVDLDGGLVFNGSFEIGNPPTGWAPTALATLAREGGIVKVGSYGMQVVTTGNDHGAYQALANPTSYRGKTVTFGNWVIAVNSNVARLSIFDGVGQTYSDYYVNTDGLFHWITVTRLIDVAATLVEGHCKADTDTAFFDGAKVVEGTVCIPTPSTDWLGDVPAKTYLKITPSGTTGTKVTYVAKRSGERYDDNLWTEGEDETSVTTIIGAGYTVTNSDENDAACSGGKFKRVNLLTGGNLPASGTLISRINYALATPPRGTFKVLARCRTNQANLTDSGLGLGYSYGSLVKTPILANLVKQTILNGWELVDLGLLNIPPTGESEIAVNSALELRINQAFNLSAFTVPTGASGFTNSNNAIDGDVATRATSPSYTAGFSAYLTLTHASVLTEGIRYWVDTAASAGWGLELDVYYAGAWHNIVTGAPTRGAWNYQTLDGLQNVTQVRIRFSDSNAGTWYGYVYEIQIVPAYTFDLDYIFLLPVDEGYAIVNSGAADIIALDNISKNGAIYIIDGSGKILQQASSIGAPFNIGRETTRVYLLRDDLPAVSFAVDTKFQTQLISV